MKFKIPKPRSIHDENKPFVFIKSMCGTCAYKTPLTDDEIEFEKSMCKLRPEGHHPCHERPNSWCVGSVETVRKLTGETQ